MNEFIFDPDLGSDEEIEEFEEMKNETEFTSGMVFSKNGVISHIERMMEDTPMSSEPAVASQWEEKCNH